MPNNFTTEQLRNALNAGYNAFEFGNQQSDNPYDYDKEFDLWECWADGYNDASYQFNGEK